MTAGHGNQYASLAAAAAGGAAAALVARRLLSRCCTTRRYLSSGINELHLSDESNTATTGGSKTARCCIYLDHNGTTPVYPAVLDAMLPYLTAEFGNPSSGHAYGTKPREAVDLARRRVLALLVDADDGEDADAEEKQKFQRMADDCIIFTGCGTESDNLAIELALASCASSQRRHVVTCNIEHPAILECLRVMEAADKIDLTIVEVNAEGIVSPADVADAIRPDQTALVTIMLANNEVGSVQPISEIAAMCRQAGVLLHTDAAQAVGKVSVNLTHLGNPDMVTIVGHKMGAPKGVAALYVRRGCLAEGGRVEPHGYGSCGLALRGGGQERGRRAGTENVPYLAGLGMAAALLTEPAAADGSRRQWERNAEYMEGLRARLLDNLRTALGHDSVRVNGPADPSRRLPNTLSVGLRNVHSGELLKAVSDRVAASAGSACHASGRGVSEVLRCLNVPEEFARGTLRLSVGPGTTVEEVEEASQIIVAEAKRQLLKSDI